MKLRKKSLTLLFFLVFVSASLYGRHIIGGVMTYECLGGNNYKFTLKIYRDCNCTMCADFDPDAFIAVYRCGQGTPCNSLNQNEWFTRLNVPLGSRSNIDAPDYPCLIPPNVCVEEGIYEFTLNLPQSNQSYHISYQRCCRNITINNILAPGDSGATYTIELTPAAQQVCNDSPVFDEFPPTVVCAGSPLSFDHSATDAEGDQLVYEFCSPLLGGGPALDLVNYTQCWGANPNPACPPPYNTVDFIAPAYTPAQPMGGSPVVSINSQTGLITGTPIVQGQFVVGVCVSEFRNGVLLSRVFRDFQFNVARCDPTVVADVQSDEMINNQQFVINSCGNNTITFVNESYQRVFIDEFEWRFKIGNDTLELTGNANWNPTVTFPGVGQYTADLLLNPGTDCGDTARIAVNVFPVINADFSFAYDTCVAGPVTFTDLSTTGSCCLTSWDWDFGDGGGSALQNPFHIYQEPGEIPVTLEVVDTNQCVDQITKILRYFPVPSLIVVSPSEFLGCVPARIRFDNLSFPIDSTYDITWNFGDGGTSGDISPVYIYESPGTYTVTLDIVSPIGCQTDTVFNDLITVRPSPTAGFTFIPERPSSLEPTVTFTDASQDAVKWNWDFGDGRTSNLPSPIHEYRDTGLYAVVQIVTHPSGCRDTLIQYLDIKPEVRYFLPNAFTPNGDSVNDGFKGVGILDGATNFRMSIWNRWGELVFETSDPDQAWNGRKGNGGPEAPAGVYLVLVSYNEPRGNKVEIKGYATLLK